MGAKPLKFNPSFGRDLIWTSEIEFFARVWFMVNVEFDFLGLTKYKVKVFEFGLMDFLRKLLCH